MTSRNRQLAQLPTDNYLINGGFDVAQRGASFDASSASKYTLDRWVVWKEISTDTFTASQQSFTPGQTDVPGEPEFFIRLACGGTGGRKQLFQKVENVRRLAGKTITLSGYARANAAATFSPLAAQVFDSADASVITNLASQNVGTTWQPFSVTVTLPSITGKTVGANSRTDVYLVNDVLSTTVEFANLKLEEGTVATPFQPRPIAEELALCQRYYTEFSMFLGTTAYQIGGNWHSFSKVIGPMRAAPTATVVSGDGGVVAAYLASSGMVYPYQNVEATSSSSYERVTLDAEL